ncbi:MAG: diaminopimelate epimerase [Magnetococcales bacterium]|nr:diaminopimelate epimerase [Magnetococcales bacterium]
MQGLGNDFVVLDHLDGGGEVTPALAAHLADRRRGVGCDQVVQLRPGTGAAVPGTARVEMRIFNADGSRAEMCGNAARCVGLYLEGRLAGAPVLTLETLAGPVTVRRVGEGRYGVDMGPPELAGEAIPTLWSGLVRDRELAVGGERYAVTALSMGNPHCVLFAADAEGFPLERVGPEVEHHPVFPHRTNVEIVQVLDRRNLRMRVWERGVGITPACGTGACAAGVAAMLHGRADRQVTVHLDGGPLEIHWREEDGRVIMTGPATEVFRGVLSLP